MCDKCLLLRLRGKKKGNRYVCRITATVSMVIEYFAEYLVETSVQQIEPAFLSFQDSIPLYHVHILQDETPQPLLSNLEISGHSGWSLSRPQ